MLDVALPDDFGSPTGVRGPLQAFSDTVAELHDLSRYVAPEVFPGKVLQSIGKLIAFDGAMMGSTDAGLDAHPKLAIEQAYIFNRGKTLLHDYAELIDEDPIAQAFAAGLTRPLIADCTRRYDELGLRRLSNFAREHAIHWLLLYGEKPQPGRSTHFITLYRRTGHGFDLADANTLQALWRHVVQSLAFNLNRVLQEIDPHAHTRALALINRHGRADAASPAFIELFKLEWPDRTGLRFPGLVLGSLINTGHYRGKHIEIFAFEKQGHLACIARRAARVDTLSPAERNVAEIYAKGFTYTEIAEHLNVSRHTVRNQLAQVYLKLGVHSKADLVRVLSSRNQQ